jgi:CMP/dCMP kinase
MEKKHIITIAGKLGSGKSTAAKTVAQMLEYTHASTGDFMRAMAHERGISLAELSVLAENDPSIDKELDDHNVALGSEENIVLDSRLGFHFIPSSFKVFLNLDPHIAAQRILKDKDVNPNRLKEDKDGFDTEEKVVASITERLASERKRYSQLYNISDHTDHSNYDLVINTGLPENSIERVPEIIIEEYKKWLAK